MTIEGFVDKISSVSEDGRLIHNPYRNEICRYNLLHYLQYLKSGKIDLMLVGEAPGYRGCALTGIPFTDEVQLKHAQNSYALGSWPRHSGTGNIAERSATVVWAALRKYHITPLIWNVFPFHPYKKENIASNRTPTSVEMKEGVAYIDALKQIFSIDDSQIFAIGSKARLMLKPLEENHYIRHPSYDYKKEFQTQFDSRIGVLYQDRVEDC